jgi:hypothetical protein
MKRKTGWLVVIAFLMAYHFIKPGKPVRLFKDHITADFGAVSLDIPDEVQSNYSNLHTTISGTNFSIIEPLGFVKTSTSSFWNGSDSSFAFYIDEQRGFGAAKDYLNSCMASMDRGVQKQQAFSYSKEFKFNGYDAIVVCITDNTSHQNALYMSFGNENFSVNMKGAYLAEDKAAERILLDTFLTSFYIS